MKTYLGLLLTVAALWAQTDSASLRVLVEDPSAAAVAGAKVTVSQSGEWGFGCCRRVPAMAMRCSARFSAGFMTLKWCRAASRT
jgi:hypothetical protein